MNRKFGQLTILLSFIFFACLVGIIYLSFVTFMDRGERKAKFLEAIDAQYEGHERHFFRQIEFALREGDLPYYGSFVGEAIRKKIGVSSLKIYDSSLRLLFSSKETKEVFQSELRHDENPLKPGESRKLASGEMAYRSRDGKFFLTYPRPYIPKPLLVNPNIEYSFNYWLFDDKTGSILFTNDFYLLNGDKESSDVLSLFLGNEGKRISWQIDGKDGVLDRVDRGNYSVYLIDSMNFFPTWAVPKAILLSILTLTSLCLIKLTLVIWRGKVFPLSNLSRRNIFFFLLTLLFYQTVSAYLPDFRYYTGWTKMRWEQAENLFIQLERNILEQVAAGDSDLEIQSKNYDPIVKEVYLWRTNDAKSLLTNRFSIEIHSFLENLNSAPTSRLIESNFEYLFIIPIRGNETNQRYVILVLDPFLMSAKKEKNRDEFFYPNHFYRLSEDVYREKYLIEPKAWDKEILTSVRHLHSGFSDFSLLEIPFKAYYFSPKANIPSVTDGLFVFKSQGVFQILMYTSFFSLVPMLLLSVLSKIRKMNVAFSEPETTILPTVEEAVEIPEIVTEELTSVETEILLETKEEAIAETKSLIEVGGVIVKKQIHQYLPPSLWNKKDTGIPQEIQRKREAIFNVELKSLVDQVTTSDAGFGRRQSDSKKMPPMWEIPEEKKVEYSLLDRVYRGDEVSLDGIVEYTRNFIQRLGSPRFSFLFLNDTIGSYHSQISFGLDYNTRSNLIFLYNDPFLHFDEKGYAAIEINEKVKLDKFISKKFSWEILAQIETIIAFNLETMGFPGLFLILLDKNEKAKFLEPHKRMIVEKLKQLVPALHVLMDKEDKTPDLFEDSLSWMVRSFLQATLGGKRNAYVTHVTWENYHPTDVNEAKKEAMLHQVSKIVHSKDRVIENSPNEFLVLSEQDIKEPLETLLKSYPFPYETRYMKYPENGENYYLYI